MDITIIHQEENKLLHRTEVTANLLFEGATPNRKDVQHAIATQLKAKEPLVIINKINTAFGNSKAIITARIYEDEKLMLIGERKNLVEKHKGHEPEEKKAAEEAAKKAEEEKAAKKVEAPKEEASKEAPVADEQNTDKPEAD